MILVKYYRCLVGKYANVDDEWQFIIWMFSIPFWKIHKSCKLLVFWKVQSLDLDKEFNPNVRVLQDSC